LIAVADINTLWRKRPFEALASLAPVLGLAPRDMRQAWRAGARKTVASEVLQLIECPVTLPPGWATRFTGWTARQLWRKARAVAASHGSELKGLVVTSPHYLELVRRARSSVPTFYYCSDDYSQYEGWGGEAILKQEAELVSSVAHSFFVSRLLAERAIEKYGIHRDNVSVSPNATDDSFLKPVSAERIQALLNQFPRLRRPIVGVVGGINDRLDFELLNQCAALTSVGGVVLVGGVDPACASEALARLQRNPRCVFVGQRPHEELPTWMQMLDVALIPYRDTLLNRACSPMRLYDHLAAGRSIVATNICEQISEFSGLLAVCPDAGSFIARVDNECSGHRNRSATDVSAMKEIATSHFWSQRAAGIAAKIAEFNSL